MADCDYIFWVALFGDLNSGKEDLVDPNKKYVTGFFEPDLKFTIGVDFHLKSVRYQGKIYKLQLHDLSNEERFKRFIPYRLAGVHCVIIFYNTSNADTLNNLEEWVTLIRQVKEDMLIILVGNRQSFEIPRKVSKEEGIELVNKFQLTKYIEISTDTGEGVEELFEQVNKLIVEKYHP